MVKVNPIRMILCTLIQNESIKTHTKNGDKKTPSAVFLYSVKKYKKNKQKVRLGTEIAVFLNQEVIPKEGYGQQKWGRR
jgi:hypothetical protein